VKTLIPDAGDLNREYNNETLLRFALVNADSSSASRQVVQALLDAGADPNVVPESNSGPLVLAIPDPELTGMLLRAGADPNRTAPGDRPPWWDVLSHDSDAGFETLKLLLDHGADVTLRDREGGPVAWAAYHAWMSHVSSWRNVQLLIERGATWKDEQEFGRTVVDMFNDSLTEREGSGSGVPESMAWIKARFAGNAAVP
jgi:ankyrin repeat protein